MKSQIKFPHTINRETKKLNFLSVTSVERFDPDLPFGCPRAWGFRTIDGIKDERTDAKTLGDETHELIEHYMRTGEDVLNTVARAGKHLIYEAGPGLVIEHESMGDIAIDGIPFYIRLDLANVRDYYLDPDGQRRALDCVEVNDWKTTGGDRTGEVSGKAKSGQELLTRTVQMPVYAAWAFEHGQDAQQVRLSHTYFGTRKRQAMKSTKLATRTEVEDRVDQIRRTIARMVDAATATSGAELEPDYEVCHATKAGCQYLPICPRSAENQMMDFGARVGALMKQRTQRERGDEIMSGFDTNAFLANLGKPAAAPVAQPVPQQGVIVAQPVAPPLPVPQQGVIISAPVAAPAPAQFTQADLNAEVARRMAELGLAPGAPPAPAPQAAPVMITGAAARAVVPDLPAGGGVLVSQAVAQAAQAQVAAMPAPLGINPTDAPVSGSQQPAAKPIAPEQLMAMPAPIQAAALAVAPAPVAAPALPFQMPVAAQQQVISPPVGNGVIITAQVSPPVGTGVIIATPAAAPAEQPKRGRGRPKKDPGAPGAQPAGSGLALFVDCMVEGADTDSLQDYVDQLVGQLCDGLKVTDLRCAPDDSPLAFGKWKGILATFAKSSPPPAGAYSLLMEGSEIRACVVEALRGLCTTYVKGVR